MIPLLLALSLGVAVAEDDAAPEETRSEEPVEIIVVTSEGRERTLQEVARPTTVLTGEALQRSLSSSVPATLEAVPGFAVQYNGPGAARPTLRGLPGDRVLLLEDGHRTGDIYWTAPDHGVMVEPLTAERIEVVRGPAGLLYGSNALGGVVNVIRGDIPTERPERVGGTAAVQGESVNDGLGAGAVVRGPLGPLAFYGEATGRRAGDTRTPAGRIGQTHLQSYNLAAGLAGHPGWGLLGGSVRLYHNTFGVPGEFDGELIPGGHPGGVTSRATRLTGRIHARYDRPIGFLDSVELRSSVVSFRHDEIEGVLEGREILGAQFQQTSTDNHLVAHHQQRIDRGDQAAVHSEGAFGLTLQGRNLLAGGTAPGTRSGQERAAGAFAYHEVGLAPFRVLGGVRYDVRHVTTDDLSPLRIRTQERQIEKPVAPRNFNDLSASLSGRWAFAEGWVLGISLARSFRNPTIEEMYSDGPHLADFSFDIGSPDLDTEIGHGVDLFVRAALPRLSLEAATYANRIDGFIYYAPTGETVRVFREGALPRNTPVFEARGDDALFLGAEGRVEWAVLPDLLLDVTGSTTWATHVATGDPLPFIPPLRGRVELRYDGRPLFAWIGSNLGAPQNRVPRPISVGDALEKPQQPTAGHALLHVGLGLQVYTERGGHTVVLQARNVLDQLWRDHLSRIKDVAPQPGRNVQLTYRLTY